MLILRISLFLTVFHYSANSDPRLVPVLVKQSSKASTRIKRGLPPIAYDAFSGPLFRVPTKTFPSVVTSLSQSRPSKMFGAPSIVKNTYAGKVNNSRLPHFHNGYTSQLYTSPYSNVHPGSQMFARYGSVSYLKPVTQSSNNRDFGKAATQHVGYVYSKPVPDATSFTNQGLLPYAANFQNFDFGKFQFDASEFPILSSISLNPFTSDTLLPAVSQTNQEPIYKTRLQKVKEITADKASKDDSSRLTPSFDSHEKQISSLPLVRHQNPYDYSVVLRAEDNPKLQAKPYHTASIDFENPVVPELSNTKHFLVSAGDILQGQVLPLQSSSSTPHLPQFQGASVDLSPNVKFKEVVESADSYEALVDQPQLLFGGNSWRPANVPKTTHPSRPSEDIRTDVEIINKKKPPPPTPAPEDDDYDNHDDEGNEDDVHTGFKTFEKEYGANVDDEEDYSEKFSKEKDFVKHSKKPYAFQLYDEKFGKYSKKFKDESKERNPSSSFTDFVSNNDDDDTDEYSSKYYSNYSPANDAYGNFEEKSEEESQIHEKLEVGRDNNGYHVTTEIPYENYEENFNKDYQNPFENKSKSKSKYTAVNKGRNEGIESSPQTNRSNNKISKLPGQNYRGNSNWHNVKSVQEHIRDDERHLRIPKKQQNSDFNVNEDEYKNISHRINEDSFGYKFPRVESTLKDINHPVESRIRANSKSSLKQDIHASPSFHKSNIPGNENRPSHDVDSYSVYPGNKWHSNKRSRNNTSTHPSTLLRASSDVYTPWKPSFYPTSERYLQTLKGI